VVNRVAFSLIWSSGYDLLVTSGEKIQRRDWFVLCGDLVCFLAFAVLGLRSHEDGITAGGILRAAVPFQVGWLLISLAARTRRPAGREADAPAVIRTWVPAWAIGLVLRTAIFDRSFAPTFAIVSLLVNAVLLLLWRMILAPLVLRRRPQT
jgi:hypothetical protein